MSFTDVLFFCDYLIQFQARYFLIACNQSLNNSVYQNDAEGSVFWNRWNLDAPGKIIPSLLIWQPTVHRS